MCNNVEFNSHGVNKLIKATILPEEKMKKIGFQEYNDCWRFSKWINFPKQYKDWEIGFYVIIPKDNSDINIMILDDDYCQHYHYQEMLERNPEHKDANIVKEQVEYWMQYLQDNGVLSGHNYGDYI